MIGSGEAEIELVFQRVGQVFETSGPEGVRLVTEGGSGAKVERTSRGELCVEVARYRCF